MKVLIRVDAAGKCAYEPPKTIRRDQWLTQEAVVTGVTCELFSSQGFKLGEGIIDLSKAMNMPLVPQSTSSEYWRADLSMSQYDILGKNELHEAPMPKLTMSVLNAHDGTPGERELCELLTANGCGDRKAYWVSSLHDYKGPRACTKQSRFLELCKSIEIYIGEDGKDSIRLVEGFVTK